MHDRVFITAVIDGPREKLISLMTEYCGPSGFHSHWRGPAASFCGDDDVWFRNGVMVVDVVGGWACEVDWAHELALEARRRGLSVTVESCDLDADCGEGGEPAKGDPEGRYFVYEKYTYDLREEYKCPRGERLATWPEEMTACRDRFREERSRLKTR